MVDELRVGTRVKALRSRRRLSLRALARKANIAVSFLSSLERGRNNVSVATLKTILDALDSNLGEFFAQTIPPPTQVVFRKRELSEISGQPKGISFKEVAAGRPGRQLQVLIECYAPGSDTGAEFYRHDAEEAGVVLKGILELTVNGQVYVLKAGDSYYFDSNLPHRFRNLGEQPVEAISVNTPPSF